MPDYIVELSFNIANKCYSLRNAEFDAPRYSTGTEDVRSGICAHILGPDYLQVIDRDSRWITLEKTLERRM